MKLKNVFTALLKFFVHKPFRLVREFITDLRKVMKNFADHDGELSTCALAFFLLISFIPASLVIISILSFFYKSEDMAAFYLTQIQIQLPAIDLKRIISIIDRIVYSRRYHAFIWIPFLFWWGSFVFDIIERGLEKAFQIEESRKFWKAKIRHFLIIVGLGFFVLFLTVFSNILAVIRNIKIVNFFNEYLAYVPLLQDIFNRVVELPVIITAATTLIINTMLIFTIYRFIPPKKLNNSSLLKGALFASFSYEVIKLLFSYYITHINDYSSIFGSLNSIVILMIWIWYTCFLFIIGAEIAWVSYEKSISPHELEFG